MTELESKTILELVNGGIDREIMNGVIDNLVAGYEIIKANGYSTGAFQESRRLAGVLEEEYMATIGSRIAELKEIKQCHHKVMVLDTIDIRMMRHTVHLMSREIDIFDFEEYHALKSLLDIAWNYQQWSRRFRKHLNKSFPESNGIIGGMTWAEN